MTNTHDIIMDEKYCKTGESWKHVFLDTVKILMSYDWSLDEISIISELRELTKL
jgi:hypothetical protein